MVRVKRALRRPAPGTVLGGLALIVATSGAAVAAIPSSDGVLTGCYNAGSRPAGRLRLIDAEAGAECNRSERLVTWNQEGQAGADGADGATNVVVRYVDVEGVLGAAVQGTARCNAGERAVSGGFDAKGNGAELIPFEDRPDPAGQGATPTGWYVNIAVPDTSYAFGIGRIYVVCVSP